MDPELREARKGCHSEILRLMDSGLHLAPKRDWLFSRAAVGFFFENGYIPGISEETLPENPPRIIFAPGALPEGFLWPRSDTP